MTSIDSGTTSSYTYNALGQRVQKAVTGSPSYTYQSYYNAFGGRLYDYNAATGNVVDYYFPGDVVKYLNNHTYYPHSNVIGSAGMMTGEAASSVVQDQLYYPWGQVWTNAGNQYDTKFASLQKRDDENGLDPTQFRMYASIQGRWLSPDPLGGAPVPQPVRVRAE